MPIRRRTLAGSSFTLLAAPRALGQPAPPPLTIIVPFAPGSSTDVLARAIAPGLERELSRPVRVESRVGAGGTVALQAVARAQPDGSIISLITSAAVVLPHVTQMRDPMAELVPVALLASVPYVLVTHESRPWQRLADVWQAARQRPNILTYGTGGTTSVGHLCMERLTQEERVDLVHVPYRSERTVIEDIIVGRLDLCAASGRAVGPHVGTLRLLAQAGGSRAPSLPSLQTVSEQSASSFDMNEFIGAVAPAGIEARVLDELSTALIRVAQTPEFVSNLFELTGAHAVAARPEQFAALLDQRTAVISHLARAGSLRSN